MLIHSRLTKPQISSFLTKRTIALIQRQAIEKRSDPGLTLIEGLLAIVIISITLVSITPPIFWAVATRVQTQRAEQAYKLAQGEIDRVRAIVERGETTNLPPTTTNLLEANVRNRNAANFPAAPNTVNTSDTAVISTVQSCSRPTSFPPSTISTFTQIDTLGNCSPNFLLQTFRSQGLDQYGNTFTGAAGQTLSGFVMGVRVYSFVAKDALKAGQGSTQPAALRGTNGLGNQLNRPLAVLYSTIVSSNSSDNLKLYRALCSSANGAC
ncbi:MAG: hypothetical protein C4288_08550 [Leptolyngbya sp. ERB_1_1]